MAGRTYEANAVISAQDRASRVANRIGRNMSRMSKRTTRAFATMAAVTTRNAKLAGLAAAGGIALSVKRAAEFEDRMADVRKVMEFDTPEGFENLSNELLEMSKTMPNTAADLAAIAAVAGQSGTALEDLTDFTKLAAQASTAFGMSAEETATALASIREQLGLTQKELERNADVTNALANNMNATESQILDFNKRVAAYGDQAGFANNETQAFGAAMIATGAEANVAATSFRNMAKALTAGDSATKRQKSTLKKLGLDAKKVSESMQENAVGTVIDLLEKLNELPEAARGAAALDLFGSEARALTPLITNVDLLRKALGITNDEAKVGSAVQREYATRLETTVAQAQIFRNRLDAMLIKMGSRMLPAINAAFDPLASGFEKTIDFMINKAEEFSQFLDGFFQGLGFEGGTSGALEALGKQFDELFGTGDDENTRGEKLARAFLVGKQAGEQLLPVVEKITDALKYMSEIELPNLDFISAEMVTNLVAYGVAMGTLNLALGVLVGIKLTPIRSLIKLLAKMAGMAVGLAATADAINKVGGATRGVGGAKPKPKPKGGLISRTLKGAAGFATRHPIATGAVIAGGAVLADIQNREKQIMRREQMLAERQRQLNDVAGYDGNGMPIYRHGGLPQPQRGDGADKRDMDDPRVRFPGAQADFVGSVQQMVDDVKKATDITKQLEMTPAGKVSAEITGDVTAELEGKADVNVRVRVDGPGRVTGATVSGTGNINPSVGTDTTGE